VISYLPSIKKKALILLQEWNNVAVNAKCFAPTLNRHLITSSLTTTAGFHFIPVGHIFRSTFFATLGSSFVNSGVILTSGYTFSRTMGAVEVHVSLDAPLRTTQVICTCLPTSSWFTAVCPVVLLDLIGPTTQRSPVQFTTYVRSTAVRLNIADALHALAGKGCIRDICNRDE